uniref:Lipocalin/cytosolic fatty-acid binding domain-containing protein n=1 Tax=Panagrolaimus sp. ES5 TaxID=591445 RepID=A0AC34FC60_9BILA
MSMQQFLGRWKRVSEAGLNFEVTENGKYKMTTRDPFGSEQRLEFELDEPTYVGSGCIYTFTLLNNMLIVKYIQNDEDKGILMHYFVKNDQLHHVSGAPSSGKSPTVYERFTESNSSSCSIV